MATKADPRSVAVWVWLPSRTDPIAAGTLVEQEPGDPMAFAYAPDYLARADAIALHPTELPLRAGTIEPEPPLLLANALRDCAPDAWGRRVINHSLGNAGESLQEADYLLNSGSDRPGALDFQQSMRRHVPRDDAGVTLEQLVNAAESVEKGIILPPALDRALLHSASVGGARPKALITHEDAKHIAKFSSTSDTHNVIKAEYLAMRLAQKAGLDVADVKLVKAMRKDVLLVRRFDRERTDQGWTRCAMLSGLSLLNLDEMFAQYASYEELADALRQRAQSPRRNLKELFGRMAFNILCGNTDDHARNHAAFWDGHALSLTPAYDICPQSRVGREASQGMLIHGQARRSQLSLCLAAAPKFQLSPQDARAIIDRQVSAVVSGWEDVCNEAGMDEGQRRQLWRQVFVNDLAFEGLENPPAIPERHPGSTIHTNP